MKTVLTISITVLFCINVIAQNSTIKEEYSLATGYSPQFLDLYVKTYQDGTSRIFNKSTGKFNKETYQYFQKTNGSRFHGLSEDYWLFGKTHNGEIYGQIPRIEIDSLSYVGGDYYLKIKNEKNTLFKINIWKKETPEYIHCGYFETIECKEFKGTTIASIKTQAGKIKYGVLDLKTCSFTTNFFVDSLISCPRTFDKVAFVYLDGMYHFYDFINDEFFGKEYISYERVPMYDTILGIYEKGVELIDKYEIYNFEIGSLVNIDYETSGDLVFAIITTDLGKYKLDLWRKKIVED